MILPAPTVHVRAPGKINLFFEVGALGADGYHDVATGCEADVIAESDGGPSDRYHVIPSVVSRTALAPTAMPAVP